MITVIVRECTVLLIGVGVSLLASLLGNAGRDFGALVAAILLPITFCLIRAAMVHSPRAELSFFWRGSYQIAIGLALILLLVFEMGVAMFAGAADIPAVVWSVVAGFGAGYVLLFCLAYRVNRLPDDVNRCVGVGEGS